MLLPKHYDVCTLGSRRSAWGFRPRGCRVPGLAPKILEPFWGQPRPLKRVFCFLLTERTGILVGHAGLVHLIRLLAA